MDAVNELAFWLVWMGAATTLGRLHGPHAGSNWFAGAAAFGFLSAALLWFISDRYLVPAHLVT
ncbi:hypothetical protein [Deinococcus sp. SL84]|nr:hypothetical protein [Deinococcus sp. SL84]MCY1701627.1 hypothetical protein [Deinococcus sp. SL84]